MILVQDRSGLSPKEMDTFKHELLAVFKKYFVLDSKSINIEWQRSDNEVALVINTPVRGKPAGASIAAAAAG